MAGGLAEMRKELSKAVDLTAWGGKREIKDSLEKVVEPLVAEAYKKCAREARPITECYEEVAKTAGLSDALKRAWGK
jgi:16S rRNA G1207 methylase RsmC